MSYGLQLSVFSEVEKTIESGVHRDATRVVVCGSECAEYSSLDILNAYFACLRIHYGLLFGLSEEPVHSVADAWSDIDIFQKGKVRESDLEVMCHSVLESVPEIRTVQVKFTCLEVDSVLECSVVTKGELLVEALLADSVLPLERVESVH